MPWIEAVERMPIVEKLTKFKVKLQVGSVSQHIVSAEILAKPWHGTTRFLVGDWEKVIFWWADNEME